MHLINNSETGLKVYVYNHSEDAIENDSNEQIKLALAKCLEQMLLRSQSISVL